MKMNNNKGMTLLELIVYLAVAALLLVPIVLFMQSASVNSVRSATATEMRISGRDILNIMYNDIRNLGFKLNPATFEAEPTGFHNNVTHVTGAGADAVTHRDSSSFIAHDGAAIGRPAYDSLTFIQGRLNDAGAWGGVETVRYFVNGNRELIRERIAPNPMTQILARNVEALQFEYSDDLGEEWVDGIFNEVTPATLAVNTTTTDVFAATPFPLSAKKLVKYIKVTIILRDDKRLAAANISPIVAGNFTLNIAADDQRLYERHEIVIPVPNNGLFP